MSNKLKGKLGENIAKDFLKKKGFKILDTNFYYSRFGEIDIIASKSNVIYFVEVKYRTKDTFGMPFEAITKAKLEKITSSALFYLANCPKKYNSYRLSAISILGDKIDFIESISI